MKWFEKEYKERFEKESTLDGIDSNALWGDISKSIPQSKPTSKRAYWKWSVVLLVCIGIVWSLVLFNTEKEQELTIELEHSSITSHSNGIENQKTRNINNSSDLEEEEATITVSKTQKQVAVSTQKQSLTDGFDSTIKSSIQRKAEEGNTEKVHSEDAELEANYNTEKESIQSKDVVSNSNSSAPNTLKEDDQQTTSRNTIIVEKSLPTVSNMDTDNSIPNIEKQVLNSVEDLNEDAAWNSNNSSLDPSVIEDESIEEKVSEGAGQVLNSSKREIISISSIERKEIAEITLEDGYGLEKNGPVKVEVNTKNPWSISIHSSTALFDLKYGDTQNPEMFAEQANSKLGKLQLGNSTEVNLEYQINNQWKLFSGLGYNQYEYQLNAIFTTDTMALDTQGILRKAINTRTVIHHNKLKTITLPIGLSYEFPVSKSWSVGTQFGAAYSYVLSQSGKVLGPNNSILVFDGEENRQFNNFLSARIHPYINYRMSDKMTLSLRFGIDYQKHIGDIPQDLSQESVVYKIGGGLIYKL